MSAVRSGFVRQLATYLVAAGTLCALTTANAKDATPQERGKYLATAADCTSCHTAEGGKPFAGGYALKSPFGTLYGSNITPDKATGIGAWDKADFERAVRQGIRKDGSYLYPAMPYGSYAKLTDDDVDALWSYFQSVTPVSNAVRKADLAFPFNIREGLAAWRGLYFKPAVFVAEQGKAPAWNRGAYLVQALGHCDECHTPRNLAQALESQHELTGSQIEGWYAPNISGDASSIVHQWSSEQLFQFLKSGKAPNNSKATGPMQEVVEDSLRYLTDADLRAITAYLKDQPAGATPLRASPQKFARLASGKAVYEDNCSSCHQSDGKGRAGTVPALAGNDVVTAREPYNVVMAILEGFPAQGSWGAMGSFAKTLNDDQIADVTNYVRTAWNNQSVPNATPWSVSTWRKQAPVLQDQSQALLCPDLDAAVIKPALAIAPQTLKQAALNKTTLSQAIASYRRGAPGASSAHIVEALSTAYCRAISEDHLSNARMSAQLDDFAQQIALSLRAKPAS
jgi:mono/diheme cytochrome c family protein